MTYLRDKGLRTAFEGMLSDTRVTRAEVEKLLDAVKDGPGLSKTERADLEKLLTRVGDGFEADARAALQAFLAVEPRRALEATAPAGGVRALDVQLQAKSTRAVEDGAKPARWWEGVEGGALDGMLHTGPMADEVVVGGATFTRQDVLDLLTALGDASAARSPLLEPARVQALYDELTSSD